MNEQLLKNLRLIYANDGSADDFEVNEVALKESSVVAFLENSKAVSLFIELGLPLWIADGIDNEYFEPLDNIRAGVIKLADSNLVTDTLKTALKDSAKTSPKNFFERLFLLDSYASRTCSIMSDFFTRFNNYSEEMVKSGIPLEQFVGMSGKDFSAAMATVLKTQIAETEKAKQGGQGQQQQK